MQAYVVSRVREFAKSFAAVVAPDLSDEKIAEITERILAQKDAAGGSAGAAPAAAADAPNMLAQQASLPVPAQQQVSPPGPPMLVFKHDCL